MRVREPVVAGQFYPADPEKCREEVVRLLADAAPSAEDVGEPTAGIVPHAGWAYSGACAAKVFRILAEKRSRPVMVLFGGAHRTRGREAAMFGDGRWETPMGPLEVDVRLAERILSQTNLIRDDPFAHEGEHSLEVQMPFIKHLFPKIRIVPIMVSPGPTAHEVGEAVGRTLSSYNYEALIVGTTDLTHYGPGYGFIPQGIGQEANTWAKEANDRRFIDLVCAMGGAEVVDEALQHHNACSSGAAAATLGAAKALGATGGVLLEHTTSSEVMAGRTGGDCNDSVGYAAIVFS